MVEVWHVQYLQQAGDPGKSQCLPEVLRQVGGINPSSQAEVSLFF